MTAAASASIIDSKSSLPQGSSPPQGRLLLSYALIFPKQEPPAQVSGALEWGFPSASIQIHHHSPTYSPHSYTPTLIFSHHHQWPQKGQMVQCVGGDRALIPDRGWGEWGEEAELGESVCCVYM